MAVSIKRIRDLSPSTASDAKLLLGEDASGNMVGVEPDFVSEAYRYLGVDSTKPKNLWNEEWEWGEIDDLFGNDKFNDYNWDVIRSVGYIPVKGNTVYYVTYEHVQKYYYDGDKNYIYSGGPGNQFTTPTNCRFLRIVGTHMPASESNEPIYAHNIAIFEGTGGTYVPYSRVIFSDDILTEEQIRKQDDIKATDVASASALKSISYVQSYIGVDTSKPRNLFDALSTKYSKGEGCLSLPSGKVETLLSGIFKPDTVYYISAYITQVFGDGGSGNIRMYWNYTDGTSEESLRDYSGNRVYKGYHSAEGKTVEAIAFSYGRGFLGASLEVEDLMLTEGPHSEYVPYVQQLYTLGHSSSSSNRNLLDNPFFTINQRGSNSYEYGASGAGYCVDRWWLYGRAIINGSGIRVETDCIRQAIEVSGLQGKNLTVSVDMTYVDEDDLAFAKELGARVRVQVALSNAINPFTEVIFEGDIEDNGISSFTFNVPTVYTYKYIIVNIYVGGTLNKRAIINAVKLEVGRISTLENDAPPDYATELLKCQRYYVTFGDLYFRGANGDGGSFYHLDVHFPTEMRVVPDINYMVTSGSFGYVEKTKYGFNLYDWQGSFAIRYVTANADL